MERAKRAWIYCYIDAPEDTHGVLKGQHEKLDIGLRLCITKDIVMLLRLRCIVIYLKNRWNGKSQR